MRLVLCAAALAVVWAARTSLAMDSPPAANLWSLALKNKAIHRFSTLFTAHDVRDRLSTDAGIGQAVDWCKRTGVTKVYVESFRSGYDAPESTLVNARDRLRAAGIDVSGCVTTTNVGKPSTGWKDVISCYTDRPTQDRLQAIFERAAKLFDEVMIDDFWFTDCTCTFCDAARRARKVTIGVVATDTTGDTWEDYRCALMTRLSRERVLGSAKRRNPKVKLIIKYPQWYDRFHERGYEVVRETADFDRIWVGTETRDFVDKQWGGTPQYEADFIMRWLGGIGGVKCGGGWYDPYGTTEATYVEQARQTVLGGARESLLFCYGSLQQDTGPRNAEALRKEIPSLLEAASQVRKRSIVGIAAYKPPNSHPESEPRVFDFVGMLGIPLVPCSVFPTRAPAAFFSIHALKDPKLTDRLTAYIRSGKPTLITDGLADRLRGRVPIDAPNVRILRVAGDPKRLLDMAEPDLNRLRAPMLRAAGASLTAPNRVALYLFRDSSWVVENFNDTGVEIDLNGKRLQLAARGWVCQWETK